MCTRGFNILVHLKFLFKLNEKGISFCSDHKIKDKARQMKERKKKKNKIKDKDYLSV